MMIVQRLTNQQLAAAIAALIAAEAAKQGGEK